MANTLYPKYKEEQLSATSAVSWTSDTIKCCMVDTGTYTYSASHQFLSSVSGIISTSAALTGKTATSGVADCDDFVFTAVSGATVEALIFYKDTGSAATSKLILYLDTATGLTFTPNTGNANVTIDNGANKLFVL